MNDLSASGGVNLVPLSHVEVREAQLTILSRLHAYCASQGFNYYLAWGTLLGAVRHGGYIPWDDDIDVMMFREDYDTFIEAFPESTHSEGLALGSTYSQEDWPYPFAKIMDTTTILVENQTSAVPLGINIDIFPIDGIPTSPLSARLAQYRIRAVRSCLALKVMSPKRDRALWKRAVLRLAQGLERPFTANSISRMYSRCASASPVSRHAKAGVLVGPSDWAVPFEAIGSPRALLFENRQAMGPTDPSEVLTAIYGDFMKLPPLDKRVTHHDFIAYRRA